MQVIASQQLLQLQTKLLWFLVYQEENQLMRRKKLLGLLLFLVHMSRLVIALSVFVYSHLKKKKKKSIFGLYSVILIFFIFLQEKWAKNLYIASICYGRTVS